MEWSSGTECSCIETRARLRDPVTRVGVEDEEDGEAACSWGGLGTKGAARGSSLWVQSGSSAAPGLPETMSSLSFTKVSWELDCGAEVDKR